MVSPTPSPNSEQAEQPQPTGNTVTKGHVKRFWDWLWCNYDPALEFPKYDDERTMPSLSLGVDFMKDNLSEQLAQADAIDTKAGFILGSASLLTGVLVAWHKPASTAPGIIQALPVFAVVVYVFVVGFAAWAYATRSYWRSPHPIKMRDEYLFQEVQQAEDTIFHGMVISWLRNDRTINRKLRLVGLAFVAFGAQVLVVGAIVLAEVITASPVQ